MRANKPVSRSNGCRASSILHAAPPRRDVPALEPEGEIVRQEVLEARPDDPDRSDSLFLDREAEPRPLTIVELQHPRAHPSQHVRNQVPTEKRVADSEQGAQRHHAVLAHLSTSGYVEGQLVEVRRELGAQEAAQVDAQRHACDVVRAHEGVALADAQAEVRARTVQILRLAEGR